MNGKITSYAFMIALVFHTVIAFLIGMYFLTQTAQFKDLIGVEVLQSKEPPKPKVGRSVVKPPIKPTVPTRKTVGGQIQVQPHVNTVFLRENVGLTC